MPTTKKRINITLSTDMEAAIGRLAKKEKIPESAKAAELIRLGLEIEEDAVWNALAMERDGKKSQYVPHAKAWK